MSGSEQRVLNVRPDENGATAVEYALMAGLIAGVVAAAVATLGPTLASFFVDVNAAL